MIKCIKCRQEMRKITTYCEHCGWDQRILPSEEPKQAQPVIKPPFSPDGVKPEKVVDVPKENHEQSQVENIVIKQEDIIEEKNDLDSHEVTTLELLNEGFELKDNKKYQEALAKYMEAFELGDERGAYFAARLIEDGLGTKVDDRRAYEFYLQAANQGHSESQYYVGMAYINGTHGFKKDTTIGIEYLKKCDESNHFEGQYFLAVHLSEVEAYQEAKHYIIRALKNEEKDEDILDDVYNTLGQIMMGIFAEKEDIKDYIIGYQAFMKAQSLGNSDAKNNIKVADSYVKLPKIEFDRLMNQHPLDEYVLSNHDEVINEPEKKVEEVVNEVNPEELERIFKEGISDVKNRNVKLAEEKLLYAASHNHYAANFMLAMLYTGEKDPFTKIDLELSLYHATRAFILADTDKNKGLNLNEMGIHLMKLSVKRNSIDLFGYGVKCFEKGMDVYSVEDCKKNFLRAKEQLPKGKLTLKNYVESYDFERILKAANIQKVYGESMLEELYVQNNQPLEQKSTTPKQMINVDIDDFNEFKSMTLSFLFKIMIELIFVAGGVAIVIYTVMNPAMFNSGSEIAMYFLALFVAGLPGIRVAYWKSVKTSQKWDQFFKTPQYKATVNYEERTVKIKKNEDILFIIFQAILNIISTGLAMPFILISDIIFYRKCRKQIKFISENM